MKYARGMLREFRKARGNTRAAGKYGFALPESRETSQARLISEFPNRLCVVYQAHGSRNPAQKNHYLIDFVL